MFKKIFLISCVLISFSLAQISQSAAISAIKTNPALLNTPQAQAEMAKRGISKSEVLSKIDGQKSLKNNNIATKKIQNKIYISGDTDNIKTQKQSKTEIINQNKNSTYINPLEYKQSKTLLQELKKEQSLKKHKILKRYGINFFRNRNSLDSSSIPVPDYYILSVGDKISIWIYGTKNENFSLDIDKNGNINIPKFGPLHITGLKFDEAKSYIQKRLKKVYQNTNIAVNITDYSTIQVNLVGDVVAPGVYNIRSLSTIKNLLIIAHGVKPTGSLRNVVLKRDGNVLAVIDFYKLLQNGDTAMNLILRANDTIFIPKARKIVSIDGEVNNPAKFELKPNETLKKLLLFAGGIKANASKFGFIVKRYIDHKKLKTIEVDFKNSKNFKLLNGDNVYVYKIDKVHKESIYLYGNVVRPGERELGKDRSLRKLLKSEISKLTLKGVFLDDTLFTYALLKRKTTDLNKKVENFNLSNILSGKKDIKLKNDDEIYIFNKYNSNIAPYVTVNGTTVIKSGKYRFYKNITIKDLLALAGTTTGFNNFSAIKITTYHTKDFMPKISILTYNIAKNYKLNPFDEIEVYDYYKQHHVRTFNISGEVNSPSRYTLNKNETLMQAIRIAGGFTPKAYKKEFEIIRYYISNNKRKKKLIKVPYSQIGNFLLKDYDEISVHIIPNWNERQTVTIKGEVNFPGTYVIEEGDKLADIIKRAGGYTKNAFLDGAIFTRESIKNLQRKRLKQSILELKQQALALSVKPNEVGQGDKKVNFIEISNMIDKISSEAQKLQPIGRISIKLERDLEKFKDSRSNIALRGMDSLTIPTKNDTILIVGEVMNSTAIVYASNDVNYYIQNAGGLSQKADSSNIFVIHANGSAQKVKRGWFSDVSTHIVRRGDTIVVPQELVTTSGMQITKDISSILYKFALTAASIHAVGAL